jgi:hypothetical protein
MCSPTLLLLYSEVHDDDLFGWASCCCDGGCVPGASREKFSIRIHPCLRATIAAAADVMLFRSEFMPYLPCT